MRLQKREIKKKMDLERIFYNRIEEFFYFNCRYPKKLYISEYLYERFILDQKKKVGQWTDDRKNLELFAFHGLPVEVRKDLNQKEFYFE